MTITDQSLLDLVKTKDQAQQLAENIDIVLKSMFTTTDTNKLLDESFAYTTKETLLLLIKEQNVDRKDIKAIEQFLQQIKTNLQNLPIIQLTIACEPKKELIEKLSSWFVIHIKKVFLLSITVDPSIIGGAIITYQGKYKNCSVQQKLMQLYKKGELALIP